MLRSFLDADDDWIEPFRRSTYPRLHGGLTLFGSFIGVPLFSVRTTGWGRYVGTLDESEECIEAELEYLSSARNPIAAYKRLPDGRESEGSWVVRHKDAPDLVAPGMQLHITLFPRVHSDTGRAVFAHYEDDWRVRPIAHLRGKNFSATEGVRMAKTFIHRSTFLTLNE
jgi:hypothetical protein